MFEHLQVIKPNVDCPGYYCLCSFLPFQHLPVPTPQFCATRAPFLGLSHVDAHTDVGIFKCLDSRPALSYCGHAAISSDTEALKLLSQHAPSTYARQTLGTKTPGSRCPVFLGRCLGGLLAKPSVIVRLSSIPLTISNALLPLLPWPGQSASHSCDFSSVFSSLTSSSTPHPSQPIKVMVAEMRPQDPES